MAVTDPHPELADVSEPKQTRLRNMFDVMHVGERFEQRAPPEEACDCEWGQRRFRNESVALLDGHAECPFCRGLSGDTES